MFCAGCHNIDPGGVDAAVAQDVCQLGDVPFDAIKGSGEQLAQIVGKHLAGFHLRLFAEHFHPRPDTAPTQRLSVPGCEDHAGTNAVFLCIRQQSPRSFPGIRIVRIFPLHCTEISPPRTLSKAPSRQVWLDEQAGNPTRYNIYRADVQEAIDCNATGKQVVQHLRKMGYIVDTTGPCLKIRLPQYPHFTRLDILNPRWTNKGLEHLIYDRDISEFGRPERPQVLETPDWLKGAYQPRKRTTKIYRLYLYYCYQLGILPKGTTYQPASPQLRADLRHLDDVDRQTRYLASHNIETVEELLADRAAKESQLEALTTQRTKLQNKIRRASPEQKVVLRKEKAEVTVQITALRKDIRDSKEIEQ